MTAADVVPGWHDGRYGNGTWLASYACRACGFVMVKPMQSEPDAQLALTGILDMVRQITSR